MTPSSRDRRFHGWGWVLFTVSALFFIASSLRSGDLLGLLGGLFFLVACAVFVIPLIREARRPRE